MKKRRNNNFLPANQYSYILKFTPAAYSVAARLAPVLQTIFINVSYQILVASLTLMALFEDRAIRVRLATI